MKKILFAAMALGMCMTSCMNDEFPNAVQYGYINLNVSNDPTLQTRAVQTVSESDLSKWTIKTKFGEEAEQIWNAQKAYKAGTYVVSAQSHENEEDWKSANEGWGAAYYEGTDNEVIVERGKTADAEINCNTAKNAKLTVTIADMPEAFKNVEVRALRNETKTLTFNGSEGQQAFFKKDEVVKYSIHYTYKDVSKIIDNKTIQMAGAATNNIITIQANDNGLISVNITYDDSFGKGESEDFTFDALTGENVPKQ